jgi:hypothetical protein
MEEVRNLQTERTQRRTKQREQSSGWRNGDGQMNSAEASRDKESEDLAFIWKIQRNMIEEV